MSNYKVTYPWLQLSAALLVLCFLYIFPGAAPVPQLLRLLGVYYIADMAYRHLCPVNRAGRIALLVTWVFLAAGLTVNVWYFTTYSGGSVTAPILFNNDASLAWNEMTLRLEGATSTHERFARLGYGIFLAILSLGGTPTIDGMLDFNLLAILVSIVLTGAATPDLAGYNDRGQRARACTTAMIFLASTSYYIIGGTILIKDAMCCLLMAVTLFALTRLSTPSKGITKVMPYALLLAVSAAAMLIRPNQMAFIGIATLFAFFFLPHSCRLPLGVFCVLVTGVYFWTLLANLSAAPFELGDATTNFEVENLDKECARLNAYESVNGDYPRASNLKKIMLLPFSLAVQFITPLPWAFARDAVFGPFVSWAHFSFPWYAIGGLLFFYGIFCLRRSPRACASMFLFAVAAWILTAFNTGGTVSRYCLPWMPFLMPAAAWLLVSGRWRCKTFRIWYGSYSALLILGLVLVFVCLNIYSPGGWEAS